MDSHTLPYVTVVVPCRNEKAHVGSFLKSLALQDYSPDRFEVIIADGMSDDGTRQVLEDHSRQNPHLRVIDNHKLQVPAGLNVAIGAARGNVILRMDVHTEYDRDYIRECVRVLGETRADNVGGPAMTRSHGFVQSAIALAYHSPFSCGGARFHNVSYEGYVDTVTYGCWKREAFERFGLFDEELARNQDDEHNLRLIRAGGKVWQSPAIRSWYHPRASLGALFRQYAQYGYWKVRVIQKHGTPASPRQLVPGGFVGTLILLTLLLPLGETVRWLWLGVVSAYTMANLAASLVTCVRAGKWRFLPVMPLVFAAYHLGYGWGFLRGIIDFLIFRREASLTFARLTRAEAVGPSDRPQSP